MTRQEKLAEQQEAQELLRQEFPPGSTAYTILRHVSRSGMSRTISVVNAKSEDVTWLVARAMGEKFDPTHGGIKVGGCGMDMGFHLVYGMSRTIYPDGFTCIGDTDGFSALLNGFRSGWCPSNDHSNGDRDYTPHNHSDGGYAVSQRWL